MKNEKFSFDYTISDYNVCSDYFGTLIGNYIDKWVGTKWIFSIILLIMGVASGFINSYKLIMSLNSTEKGEKERDRK